MKLNLSLLLMLVLTWIPGIFVFYEVRQQPFQSFNYDTVNWSLAGMVLIIFGYFFNFIYEKKPLKLLFYLVGSLITISAWVFMFVKIAGNYWG